MVQSVRKLPIRVKDSLSTGLAKVASQLSDAISNQNVQRTVSFVVGGLVIVAGAMWTLFVYYHPSPTPSAIDKPFDQFYSYVQQLTKPADQVFTNCVTFDELGWVAALQVNPHFQVTDLFLKQEAKDFITSGPVPTFFADREAVAVLSNANSLLVSYAGALQQLAVPNLVSEATFDQITTDLSTETASLSAAQARVNLLASDTSEPQFFSPSAVEAAHLFIQKRRREELLKVILINQSAVDKLSVWSTDVVDKLKDDLYVSYGNQMSALVDAFDKAPPGPTGISARGTKIREIGQIDLTFLNDEDSLKALGEIYKAVPKAHQNLAVAVQNEKGVVANFQTLQEAIGRLQNLSSH